MTQSKQKRIVVLVFSCGLVFPALCTLAAFQATPHPLNEGKIAAAAGSKATTTPDGVVRLAWGRTDVPVTIDGMSFKPAAGLGSWAAFTSTSHGAMVMGDTVLFQDEV